MPAYSQRKRYSYPCKGKYIAKRVPMKRMTRSKTLRPYVEENVHYSSGSSADMQPGTFFAHDIASGIAKGNDYGDRTGSKIFLKSFGTKLRVHNRNTTKRLHVRVALLEDKKTNMTLTTNTFMPESQDYAPINFADDSINILRDWNLQRFKVLYNHVFVVGANTGDRTPNNVTFKQFTVKINRTVEFNNEILDEDKVYPRFVWVMFMQTDDGASPSVNDVTYTTKHREYYNP